MKTVSVRCGRAILARSPAGEHRLAAGQVVILDEGSAAHWAAMGWATIEGEGVSVERMGTRPTRHATKPVARAKSRRK